MVHVNNTTSIYRNVKTGVYFVQPYTFGPVAATEFGDATIVTPEEFDSSIAGAVLQNLERFGKEPYDRSRAIIRSQKQQKDFIKNHVGVTINQRDSGELVVYALHRERGGMVGSHDDTFVVPKADIRAKLAATIAEAFQRAT